MAGYKTEVTLNEQDSLQDMINIEKTLVKLYAMAITEGCSKGFRKLIKEFLLETIDAQFDVFMMMTERDYYSVTSAPEAQLSEQKNSFNKVKTQLS